MVTSKIDLTDPKYIDNGTVQMTQERHSLSIGGVSSVYSIFKVKLDVLYYNDKNGRISTWINKYERESGPLDKTDLEKYNSIIHGFIRESNPEAMNATKNNIHMLGQEVPGVILPDGRIIDGNRRFTCLRELFEEKKGNSFGYFKTIILDGNHGPNDKSIKALELNLQLGKEKPLDYDPIERMLDAYENIIKTGTFTIDEYCREANLSRSKVNLLLNKAELMVEFLKFIGYPEQYYVAREMDLDGPLQEAVSALNKCKNKEDRARMKNNIFAALAIRPEEDMTRHIRNYKKIADSKDSKSILNQIDENAEKVLTKIDEISKKEGPNNKDPAKVIEQLRSDEQLKAKIIHDTSKAADHSDRTKARELPVKYSKDAFDSLDDIDLIAVSEMSDSSKRDLLENINAIAEKIKEIRDILE